MPRTEGTSLFIPQSLLTRLEKQAHKQGHVNRFEFCWSFLHRFCEQVGRGPDDLLAWARASQDEYAVLDQVQAYVNSLTGKRHNSMLTAYAAIRSFFMHNRTPLPPDASFRIRSDVPPVQRKITIENLRELVGLATQPWRSMILVKWMALLDTTGLIYVNMNYGKELADATRSGQNPVKLLVPGRKWTRNQKAFYTYLGHDALLSLREYFERERGYPHKGEAVWLFPYSKLPVSKQGFDVAWLRLLRRARMIPKTGGNSSSRYGFNVHNTRDLAISLLNTVPGFNAKCAEFFAGHDIDPLGYNEFYNLKPDYVAAQYQLAEPYLNIVSQGTSSHVKSGDLLDALREAAEKNPAELRKIWELMQSIDLDK